MIRVWLLPLLKRDAINRTHTTRFNYLFLRMSLTENRFPLFRDML